MWHELIGALRETFIMIIISSFTAIILGFLCGITLYVWQKSHNWLKLYTALTVKNIFILINQIPYLAIMVACIPLMRWAMPHDQYNPPILATIPLTLAMLPSISLSIYSILNNLPKSLILTANSMGANNLEAVLQILIPNSRVQFIKLITQVVITLLAYSTIAGALGAGGLGQLIIQKGFYIYNIKYVICCIGILIIINQTISFFGNLIADHLTAR